MSMIGSLFGSYHAAKIAGPLAIIAVLNPLAVRVLLGQYRSDPVKDRGADPDGDRADRQQHASEVMQAGPAEDISSPAPSLLSPRYVLRARMAAIRCRVRWAR
jgi:hypothetical protein